MTCWRLRRTSRRANPSLVRRRKTGDPVPADIERKSLDLPVDIDDHEVLLKTTWPAVT